jgi:cobalamin biosynthetic protein CobC
MSLTHHGGRLNEARALFGGDAADWLDLSTGINPNPWQPSVTRLDWRALPDPQDLTRLEHTAATYFGADPSLCLAVPGSESALRALGHILSLPGIHQPLTYSTHSAAFPPGESTGPTARIIANPNNPDGALTPRETLLTALAQQEESNGWLIIDEAFADCAPEHSIADHVSEDRRLIITRSFGKFFGLAGLRLGFVLAPSALLTKLRALQGDWPLSTAALTFGTQAYADTSWTAQTRATLPATAARLDALLLRHGLKPQGACPLFRLLETSAATDLFTTLAHNHILTRPFATHPNLLRLGLPKDDQAFTRLDKALRHG